MTDYKLVPMEPTLDMLCEGTYVYGSEDCAETDVLGIYKAMIAAAPDVQEEPVFMWHRGATDDESEVVDVDCACPCCVPLYLAPQPAEQRAETLGVVYVDGVGAGRRSLSDCRDGVRYITVADTVYWPLTPEEAQRLRSAECGRGEFTGPTSPECTTSKDAEIECLRAEVAEWKRVAAAQAELQGEAEERAERLVEALEQCITSMLDSGYRADAIVIRAARTALAAYRKGGDV